MLRSVGAVAVALGLAAAAPACTFTVGRNHDNDDEIDAPCRPATVTAEPGRVVTVDGKQQLELRGRLTDGSKPLAGATIDVVLTHMKPDGTFSPRAVGERTTEADGSVVFRQPFDTLGFDIRVAGPLTSDYRLEWRFPGPFKGVQYCSGARADAPLPLDQLPKG